MKKTVTVLAIGGLLALPGAASAHHPPAPTPPVCVPTVTTVYVDRPVEVIKYVNVDVPGPIQIQYVDRPVEKIITKVVVKYRTKIKWKIRYRWIPWHPKPPHDGPGVTG